MTKFILHGGSLGKKSEKNQNFFAEVTKGLPVNSKILGIYFAREEYELPDVFEQDKERFLNSFPKKKFQYILAEKDLSVLSDQMREANAIFLSGGNENYLKEIFREMDLEKLVQGKIISGSSAGANIFSKYYFTNDRDSVEEGFGILPIKTICHYKTERISKLEKLKNYKESLEIFSLADEGFVVLEI
jgi:peptidase E